MDKLTKKAGTRQGASLPVISTLSLNARLSIVLTVPNMGTRWTELIDSQRDGYDFQGAN